MQSLLVLLGVFRMVVLPVQFEDRELATARAQQEELVQQAQAYFDRQFAGSGTSFRFDLAPAVTLSRSAAWYGVNYPDRKDVRIAEAVREATQELRLRDAVHVVVAQHGLDRPAERAKRARGGGHRDFYLFIHISLPFR